MLFEWLMRLCAVGIPRVARGAKRSEHGADRKARFLRDCRKRGAFVPKLRQSLSIDFDPWTAKFHATPARRLLARFHTVGDQTAFEFGVLQFFAICRLCGARDYAKPQHRGGTVACISVMWGFA
jgi:hypothetical protein